MKQCKIGVIGAGVLGSFHLQKCVKNQNVQLCGFFDLSADRRSEVSQKLGVKAYDDVDALITQCDGLIVATPSSTHVEMAAKCLDAKKHVFVEKPLAPTYEEGKFLLDKAVQANCIVQVGHSEAFNAAFVKLLSHKPHPKFIEIHRLAQFSPRGTDVPVVLDLMVHDLQLLLRLCNDEPLYDKIAATGVAVVSDDIDIANARIPFRSGCVANLTASRISAKRMRKIRLFERDCYFSVDLDKEEVERYALDRNATNDTSAMKIGGIPIAFGCEKVTHVDALETELTAFSSAIMGLNGPAGVSGKEALNVLKITDTILSLIATNPVA